MNKTNNTEIIVMAEDNASVPRTLSSSGNISPEKPSPEEVSLEEKWENAGIGNAFIFGKVMSANPGLLLEFLQVSLPEMEIREITDSGEEVYIKTSIDAHGVRLDITVRDSENRVFDIEMQLRDEKDIPRRIRYYVGAIDQTNLKPGVDYSKLKDTVVIFITPFDPFNRDRYRYTFRNICLEEETLLELDDGTAKVILNAAGNKGEISPALKGFFALVKGLPAPTEDSFAGRVQKQVKAAKRNSAWRREFMNWEMTLLVERRKGREEGRIEGKMEGRDLLVINKILRKHALGQSEDKIAEDLLESSAFVHEILSIAAGIKDPTAENVYAVYEQKKHFSCQK